MKRSWISLAILLAAISMVNASPFYVYKRDGLVHLHKRAVAFAPCKEPSTIVLTGSVDPDPAPGGPAKAKMSFVTTAEGPPKLSLTTTITEEGAAKAAEGGVTTADLCASGLKCPVGKGKEITVESTIDVPAGLKVPFTIEYNINDGAKTIACGIAKVAKAGEAPKDGAPKGDDGAPKGDDGAPKGDDGAPKGDDGAPKGDDGAPKGDDGAPKGDDGAPKGDDGEPKRR
jgi:hypothetical protein